MVDGPDEGLVVLERGDSKEGVLTAMFPNFLVASVLKNNVFADGLGFVFNTRSR